MRVLYHICGLGGFDGGGSWLMTGSTWLKFSLAMPTRPPDGTSLGALSQVGTDRSDPLPLLLFSSLISSPSSSWPLMLTVMLMVMLTGGGDVDAVPDDVSDAVDHRRVVARRDLRFCLTRRRGERIVITQELIGRDLQ